MFWTCSLALSALSALLVAVPGLCESSAQQLLSQGILVDDIGAEDFGPSVLEHVNPLIGTTGWSSTEYGGMIPNVAPPFAMTQWSAMTRENYVSRRPYHHDDCTIQGFIGTHQPAIWMGDYGYVAVAPGFGRVIPPFSGSNGFPYSHENETSKPHYYSVSLDAGRNKTIKAELAATSRVGHLKFTFSHTNTTNTTSWVVIQATRGDTVGHVSINNGTWEISGYNPDRQDSGLGPFEAASFKGYFVARFDTPFLSFGTVTDSRMHEGQHKRTDRALSAFARFAPGVKQVSVRVGTSFISVEQARRNLEKEIPDGRTVEETAMGTKALWEEKLGRVAIQGGTSDQRTVFYTGMYHALQYPNEILEDGSYYSGYTDTIHTSTAAYTSYSNWDIFRAQFAFLILFAPERIDGMIMSMLQVYEQSGWLPIWQNPVETNIMVGTHADSLIAEALVKGFDGFDIQLAFEAAYKDAMIPPDLDLNLTFYDREQATPVEARAGLTYYKDNGWVAADRTAAAGSRTLDYAYDDYCVSVIANLTGHSEEGDVLQQRSQNYRKIFHYGTGFMEARNRDGSWAGEWVGWTEGDRWVYSFSVMQDIPGLIELMGRDRFISLITEHFVGRHNKHDNEPSHHIPYLYTYLGGIMTSKTQKLVRELARDNYKATPDGLDGNEDCGQMSTWFIFTALGFYPVNPVSASYSIGSPLFDRVSIRLPGRADSSLIISSPGAGYKPYVKSLHVDGRRLESPFITHKQLVGARSLYFEMSEEPVPWG